MTASTHRTLAGVAVAVAALLSSVALAPAAQAAFPGYTFFVRPGDFVDPMGVEGNAAMQVRSDGVHLRVGRPSGIVAASFDIPGGVPLYDFNQYGYHVTYGWSGTTAQPAIHYDIDLDGDGRPDLELVGEHQYGDDLWLNPDAYRDPALPLAALQAAAPCRDDQAQRRLQDGCAATYGSTYHGTISDWRTGLADRGYADGSVVRGGFVATGGVINGVLSDLHVGIATFVFTTDPRVVPTLTLAADRTTTTTGSTVAFSGTVDGTYNYPDVILQQKDGPDGSWHNVARQTFTTGDHYEFDLTLQQRGVLRFRAELQRTSYNQQKFTQPVAVRVR